MLTLLLGRARALEEAAAAATTRRAKRAARRAEEIGGVVAAAMAEEAVTAHAVEASSAWVMDLAATLLAKETATASVDALVAVMRVRLRGFFFSREGWFLLRLFFSTRRTCRLRRRVDTPVGRLVFLPLVRSASVRARARLADDPKNSVSGF